MIVRFFFVLYTSYWLSYLLAVENTSDTLAVDLVKQ